MKLIAQAAVVLALCAGWAHAQPFPSKPVRVIVPYPSGGIVDLLARAVTEKIAAGWGQPILVEGRPGADGNLGTEAVAKSAADGYTWLMTGPAILSNPTIYANLPWNPLRDFQGVGAAVDRGRTVLRSGNSHRILQCARSNQWRSSPDLTPLD